MDLLLNYLHSGLSAIVPFIILLGLLIFVHELGHFLVAKYFGVKVETFSLGFGKKIFSYKKGDTDYCISIIPLGGYVKMFGDELGSDIPEDLKKLSFTHKPLLQRMAIVLAGPVMNFLFAIAIFALIGWMGEEVRAPKIGDVTATSEAFLRGFRSGDTILAVDGKKLQTWDEFQSYINEKNNQSVSVEVLRENSTQQITLQVTPILKANPNILSTKEFVGDIDGLSFLSAAPVVGIRYGSVAHKAGLKTGDLIVSINNYPISFFRELENVLITKFKEPIEIAVKRTVAEKVEDVIVRLPEGMYSSLSSIGAEPADLFLYKVVDNSPAKSAGLMMGDRILKINSEAVTKWENVLQSIKSYSGSGIVPIEVEREGKVISFEITPKMTAQMTQQGAEEKRYTIGIVPWIQMAAPALIQLPSAGLFEGVKKGFDKTVEVTNMTIISFLRLIQAKISPKNIGGVISIGQAASETFQIGIRQFLQMMAIISVNLFILNLLPIPVLDGGHLLFFIIEGLKGAPLSMRKMEIAQQVGLVLLMSLMVFALFNDFSRLFGMW
jgi:regulator of sigma E protease